MDLPFPAEDLARLYRFALLMTGGEAAAQQALYDACLGSAARLGSYRNHESAFACLLGGIRSRAKSPPEADPAAPAIARAFATLPEAERAALGMLYSGLLPARVIAEVLNLPIEKLAALLKSARSRLERSGLPLDDEPHPEAAL